jgi:hypothetical protein
MRVLYTLKRNLAFCISVTGVLVLHLIAAWKPLYQLEGFPFLWSKGPLIDDSYIIFKISRDLADWLSGVIASPPLTTGFQPLIALLYTPFFLICWNSKVLPIHLALSLNAILGFFGHILLYCLLRKVASRAIVTFLVSVWIWSPYVMNQTINGMETSLALLFLLSVLNFYWKINQESLSTYRSWLVLGILLGLGFWTRVDLGMVGVAIVIDQVWLTIKGGQYAHSPRLRNIFLCSLTALIIASPWLAFIFIRTGDIVPLSGKGVHQITSLTFDYFNSHHLGFPYMMLVRFIREFLLYQPLVTLSKNTIWQFFISGLALIGLILVLRNRKFCNLFRPIWSYQAIMLVSYLVFIGGFWHLNRYLYPVYTLMLLLHAVTLHSLESKIAWKKWTVSLICFSLFLPYAFSYTFTYHSFFSRLRPSRYFSAAHYVKQHIPPEEKIGTFQSGALSYWLDNQVINLDGVINRKAYLHVKDRTLGTYLDDQEIKYLVEETYLFRMWDHYLEKQLSRNYSLVMAKPGRGWYKTGIYKRKP